MSLQKQDYGTATKMEESETKLRFQWSDHGGELGKLSRSLFGSDDLSDVTLTCRGGKAYHAHRLVLAAASTYFRHGCQMAIARFF